MRHPERVDDYLVHIVQAIERATSYLQPLQGIEAFRQNPQVQDAVVRNIEIIGEAANHIARAAPDFIPQHLELPWTQMRNMRNIVIHAYFNVDFKQSGAPFRKTCLSCNSRSTSYCSNSTDNQTVPDESSRPRGRRGRRPRRTQPLKP